MRHVLLVPLLVLVTVLSCGCGESRTPPSAQEFEQSIVLTRDHVDFALARIAHAGSKDEFLERMDEAADTIDGAAQALEGAGAPKRYETELGDLVGALRQLAFDVQATADQIREPGFGDLLVGTRGLSFESWDAVNRALAALRAKGVEVRLLQRH